MAFPALLFIIALASTVGSRLDNVTFGIFGKGVVTLVLVFTAVRLVLPGRIIRAQVLSLREKEFIEAARMVGASDWRIIRSHLLPHLVAPIIVFSTLIVASYILAEAGLSFLGLGHQAAHRELGQPAPSAPEFYTTAAVADGLAGPRRAPHDARVQPARRRPARRVRPALARSSRLRTGLHEPIVNGLRLRRSTELNLALTNSGAGPSNGSEDAFAP